MPVAAGVVVVVHIGDFEECAIRGWFVLVCVGLGVAADMYDE